MVFRGGADHARSADVDLFDRLRERYVRLRDRFFKWIKIANNDLERNNPMIANGGGIRSQIGTSENGAVDLRMQRFHAAIHDLRKAGIRRNIDNGEAVFLQELPCPAGRNDLKTQFDESSCERSQTRFIADAH